MAGSEGSALEHTLPHCREALSVVFFIIICMILLESTRTGYTYIGSDANYYCVIRNDDCGAPDEIYPMQLGPITPQEFDEIPF